MKKSVQETLRLAVEQLFVRIHIDLISDIQAKGNNADNVSYDENNPAHANLVQLCKSKIGYKTLASNQDIFKSILSVYQTKAEKEAKHEVRVGRA